MDPLTISALLAGGGALLGGLGSAFGTKPEEFKQVPRFTPQQSEAQNALLMQALAGLQDPTKGFAPIEQQARSQFAQRTIPSIAERFAAADAQRSSGFQQALGQAGAGLEENLASLRAQYGQNQLSQLLNMINLGLQPQFETAYSPAGQTGFGRFATAAGAGLTQAGLGGLTGLFGGGSQMPMGTQGIGQGASFGLPQGFGSMPDLSSLFRQNLMNRGFGGSPLMSGGRAF